MIPLFVAGLLVRPIHSSPLVTVAGVFWRRLDLGECLRVRP